MIRKRMAGKVSRYERRFGRLHRRFESEITGVSCPSSRGKHPITSDDKQHVKNFIKTLVRGDEVEVSATCYDGVYMHPSDQTFVVGEDSKKSIQQYIIDAMEDLPESDGLDGDRNYVNVDVNGDSKLQFLKGGWVSYPIRDWGYSSPQEALDDGMLLCDDDTDYLWYEEVNDFV